jgi:hypothetical protein
LATCGDARVPHLVASDLCGGVHQDEPAQPENECGWHLEPVEETDDISNKIGHRKRFGCDP